PMMLIRCTRDFRYAFVNRAYAQLVGRSPDQIVGKRINEIIGEAGFSTIRPHIEKALRGEVVEYESDVPVEGIGTRYVRGVYEPDRSETGEIRGWIASISDLTDRKQADLTRARLSSIVESTEDAIISKDLEGNVLTWNDAAERMLGYQPNEI